jgi:hypothetical protein
MSIIQTTATAGDRVWIPGAGTAGTRAEHAWEGSHEVLGFDDGRTDAPLREARRALRRLQGATALAIAIAVALVWLAAYASAAHLAY